MHLKPKQIADSHDRRSFIGGSDARICQSASKFLTPLIGVFCW
jgi:hypothetical protein